MRFATRRTREVLCFCLLSLPLRGNPACAPQPDLSQSASQSAEGLKEKKIEANLPKVCAPLRCGLGRGFKNLFFGKTTNRRTGAKSQQIVAQGTLSCLQPSVPFKSSAKDLSPCHIRTCHSAWSAFRGFVRPCYDLGHKCLFLSV
eukprot:g48144.t1